MTPESPGLFVDCDDTLILYLDPDGNVDESGPHPYGAGADKYIHNERLIAGIRRWRERNDGPVVIWSGGGGDYAAAFAVETGVVCDSALAKDSSVPRDGDLCVDDDSWFFRSSRGTVMSWREFLETIDVGV